MMDLISLHGIEIFAHHGVLPAERELGQRFVVDVDLWRDLSTAALSDELDPTVDYSEVHRVVAEVAGGPPVRLLESLAGRLCRVLLAQFELEKVGVCVHKLHPPLPQFTGEARVTLVRDRTWLDRMPEDSA